MSGYGEAKMKPVDRLDADVNGYLISGRHAPDGSGWCWYCDTHHARVESNRTPCCGDCWFDTAPGNAVR